MAHQYREAPGGGQPAVADSAALMTVTLSVLRTWFSVSEPVGRRAYAATGFTLTAVKYLLDTGAVYLAAGKIWSPLAYLSPLLSTREAALRPAPEWLLVA